MKRSVALLLVLLWLSCLAACKASGEADTDNYDYPPMVMFNDVLYTAASYMGDKSELTLVGKIESCIDYGIPTENNQANDPLLGCEIYAVSTAPGFIFVLNHGRYSSYKTAAQGE